MTRTDRVRLLDVNVLIALTNPSHVRHDAAHRWLAGMTATTRWATTPLTESALVRLMTNPVVAGRDIEPAAALQVLGELRASPEHVFIVDDASLADARIALTALVGTKQVTDFHLVNLAASAGAVLATFDTRITESLSRADRDHVEIIDPAGR